MSNIFDLEFYKAENGKIPVREFLYSLEPKLRAKAFRDIARIFYFTYCNNKYILLHGFVKKTIKTPKNEIEKARKYMEDYRRRMYYE